MSTDNTGGTSGAVVSSVITAFVAVLPDEAVGYLLKLVSVFVLAMVAEGGRRLMSKMWKR